MQKNKIGVLFFFNPKNRNTKRFLYQLRDTNMEGLGYEEISVGYYRQLETSETDIYNIRCKGYLRKFCCEVTRSEY